VHVLGASAAFLKWTCDRVNHDGAGDRALLSFLAARELREKVYLRPTRSTDDDSAQASDNEDDDDA
jgi:hypothetical protein